MPSPVRPPLANARYVTPGAEQGSSWWRQPPSALAVALGTAAALALAIVVGLVFSPSLERAPAPPRKAATAPATPAQAVQRLTFPTTTEPYRPPNDEAVRDAYAEARRIFGQGGVSALARRGLTCFETLARTPGYRLMDYCIAFDLFAAAFNAGTTEAGQPSPTSWLGSSGARHLNVAQAVMGLEGDAEARLFDLRRSAALMVGATPPPPPPVYGMRVMVEPPRAQEPAPASPPPQPAAVVAEPRARPAPSPDHIEIPAPTPPVATTSPSFNCRYARTRSERMVCADATLAAADRRLDRAFREAVRSGQSASELRRAQDRWLGVREAAASSPDAVAEVYERRIAQLEALAGPP